MNLLSKINQIWVTIRYNFWFVPGLIVVASAGLAIALVAAEPLIADDALARWPRLFGAGAEGSRGLLVAVATSMITVAGVVFSITVVAITLCASLYSSRVLRNFMRDRSNQTVLGVFVGIFAYCLIVVRTIRSGEEINFVPSLAVFGGLVLALVGIAVLIFFIHHISLSVQVAHILAAICRETLESIDVNFPDKATRSEPAGDNRAEVEAALRDKPGQVVFADRSGYIQAIDIAALVGIAAERDWLIRLEHSAGAFLIEGRPALSIIGDGKVDAELDRRLRDAFSVGPQRTIEQDPAFGIRQIVDVALKALSPGVNDTTTAVMCIDYLTLILMRLGERELEPAYRDPGGRIRLIAKGPTFPGLLGDSLDQIRQNAGANVAVLAALLRCLEHLGARSETSALLLENAVAVGEVLRRTVESPLDRHRLENSLLLLVDRFSSPPPP